jgi:murein DD-endopeptidase MepM/ murein hydrolase activator NlpD
MKGRKLANERTSELGIDNCQLSIVNCSLLILMLLFAACKTSHKAVSEPSVNIAAASSSETATTTPSTNAQPAVTLNPAVETKPSVKGRTSVYPAAEYYGDSWNTEHVRLNASPTPAGTVTLTVNESNFVMPACGKVNSEFGRRGNSMHSGIDIKVETDDPGYCAFDGMVRMAKNYGAYGKVVVVRHENGLETVYSHLNSIAVSVNQSLNAGDLIGGGGRTGNASGVHLHFETRFKGEPFNPRLLIDFENCRVKSSTLILNESSYQLYGKNMQAASPQQKPAAATATSSVHVVQKGDTLYSLAKRYGTTVEALRKLNQLTAESVIKVGQKLRVR